MEEEPESRYPISQFTHIPQPSSYIRFLLDKVSPILMQNLDIWWVWNSGSCDFNAVLLMQESRNWKPGAHRDHQVAYHPDRTGGNYGKLEEQLALEPFQGVGVPPAQLKSTYNLSALLTCGFPIGVGEWYPLFIGPSPMAPADCPEGHVAREKMWGANLKVFEAPVGQTDISASQI